MNTYDLAESICADFDAAGYGAVSDALKCCFARRTEGFDEAGFHERFRDFLMVSRGREAEIAAGGWLGYQARREMEAERTARMNRRSWDREKEMYWEYRARTQWAEEIKRYTNLPDNIVGNRLDSLISCLLGSEYIGFADSKYRNKQFRASSEMLQCIFVLLGWAMRGKDVERAPGDAPKAAIENLRENQRQLDMDGVEVGVSRQALDEVLAWLGERPAT